MEKAIESALEFANRVHKFVNDMLGASVRNAKGTVVNEFYFVPMTLLARALGHHRAIALLVKEGYPTEAAIVALTQFELCLDILYMSDDPSRATAWMQHGSETRQPWNVTDKIKAVYSTDPETREGNHGAFRNLSQIKHANPLAGPQGFPMRWSGPIVTVQTNPDPDQLAEVWSLVVLLFCCHKVLEAAAAVRRCHSQFVDLEESLERQLASFMVECHRLMSLIPAPDLPNGKVH